jgi:hypothetical protein
MERRDDQTNSGWRGRRGWLAKVGCLVGGGARSDRVRVFQPITLLGSSLERPQRFNTRVR